MSHQDPTRSVAPPCPCCTIFTNTDFFLPPPTSRENGVEASENQSTDGHALLSPRACWELLVTSHGNLVQNLPIIVDSHGHAHLSRTQSNSSKIQGPCDDDIYFSPPSASRDDKSVVSLTCAVHPADWDACLEYAAASPFRIPALGVHPWYLAADLPETWLADLERLLQQHPGCLVGEIGLCKMARFVRTFPQGKQAALLLQRTVFIQQLQLAAQYRRPVSVHCVDLQSVLLEVLREEQEHLPPCIALHSFSGTAQQVKMLLQWEASLERSEPLLYFGFSHVVNYAMSTSDKARVRGIEAVLQVPTDRLLAESDVHREDNVAVGTAGSISYIAWARQEHVLTISNCTRRNGLLFLSKARNWSDSEGAASANAVFMR
jgi:Tat protein secretion system quality control protein TatD with DNase activity